MSDLKRIADALEKIVKAIEDSDSAFMNITIKTDAVTVEGIEIPADFMPNSAHPLKVEIV